MSEARESRVLEVAVSHEPPLPGTLTWLCDQKLCVVMADLTSAMTPVGRQALLVNEDGTVLARLAAVRMSWRDETFLREECVFNPDCPKADTHVAWSDAALEVLRRLAVEVAPLLHECKDQAQLVKVQVGPACELHREFLDRLRDDPYARAFFHDMVVEFGNPGWAMPSISLEAREPQSVVRPPAPPQPEPVNWSPECGEEIPY